MNANYTLLDILTNELVITKPNGEKEKLDIINGVEIPMIQRDYAQGRQDGKTPFIRNKFLKDIHNVFLNVQNCKPDALNLDFVYGYIENKTFVPLDGQQRLTTLFIIHWFLAFKDQIDPELYGISRFKYKTRQSAKEFLSTLNTNSNQEKIRKECTNNLDNISQVIKNQPWFNAQWKYDPTVTGFIQTLSEVALMFNDISFNTVKDSKALSFHFLKIDEYGLSDNLYIKMNARGKPLSDFENFKASFEKIISYHPNKNNYLEKIDGLWLDRFWEYASSSLKVKDKSENIWALTKKCDAMLLNFIDKITEYIFYNGGNAGVYKFSEESLEQVYKVSENLDALIQLFGVVTEQEYQFWDSYFEQIFSNKYKENHVATNQDNTNLVVKVLQGESLTHFENILLFGWLNFICRKTTSENSSDLKDFLRIIRNFINNINQKNKTSLDSELRTEYYNEIISSINRISVVSPYENLAAENFDFRKEYITFECDKYQVFKNNEEIKKLIFKFEDHSTLRGLIFNFNFSPYNEVQIGNIVENFYGLYSKKNNHKDIIRLLLSFDNYAVTVGHSNLGRFKFFGQEKKWHRVLASPDNEVGKAFSKLFEIFSGELINDWNQFISQHVNSALEKYADSWIGYCMQDQYKMILDHPIFTENHAGKIEIYYNQSLNSYHHNPFVFWFRYHSPPNIRMHIDEPASSAQYSVFSKLVLKNGVQLEQIGNNWYIHKVSADVSNRLKQDENGLLYLECQNLIDDLLPLIPSLNAK